METYTEGKSEMRALTWRMTHVPPLNLDQGYRAACLVAGQGAKPQTIS